MADDRIKFDVVLEPMNDHVTMCEHDGYVQHRQGETKHDADGQRVQGNGVSEACASRFGDVSRCFAGAASAAEAAGHQSNSNLPSVPHANQDFASVRGLADIFLHGLTVRYWRGAFWFFQGGAYTTRSQEDVQGLVYSKITREASPNSIYLSEDKLKAILFEIKNRVRLATEYDPPFYVNDMAGTQHNALALENGLLFLDANPPRFVPNHDANLFIPGGLPYVYDPHARCDRWDAFLTETFAGDANGPAYIRTLRQWFALNLLWDTSLQRFLLLHGRAGTGKSTILSGLQELIGRDNYTTLSLKTLHSAHGLAPLVGKRANIYKDLNHSDRMDTDLMKMMIDGNDVTINEKYKPVFQAPSTVRFSFACNRIPAASHGGDGIWRRMLLIPCNNVPAQPNPQMASPNYWQQAGELPGMLCWALEGLQELKQNGFLEVAAASGEMVADAARDADPVLGWLEGTLHEAEPSEWVWHGQLYDAFTHDMQVAGVRPIPNASFLTRVIKEHFPTATKKRLRNEGGFDYKWFGIAFR